MAPRKRSGKNADLPPNLYVSNNSYQYRHPINHTRHGMGTDRRRAIQAAHKLNLRLVKPVDEVAGVLQKEAGSVSNAVSRYVKERQPQEKLAEGTLKLEGYRINALLRDLGAIPCSELSVRQCADWLDQFKGSAYIKHRGTLIKICRFAVARGLMERNPAEGTLTVSKIEIERKRLPISKAQFDAIYARAPDWLQVAMDLALITLQRRGDLVTAQYDDIKDGVFYVIQDKTKKHGHHAYLKISMGRKLRDVVQRSRQIAPVCPFIIHRKPERKKKAKALVHWAQITPDNLTKTFAKVRDELPEFAAMPEPERPTFHGIRGLGGHLYEEAGYDKGYIQRLMGHTKQKMTDAYTDQHIEWTECSADLEP